MVFPSPCNGLCSFERRTGFCMGCARTRDEIVGWRDANDDLRRRIESQLSARSARLGFVQRLPWSPEDIRSFIVASLQGTGTWVVGIHGAIGAFRRAHDEVVDVDVGDMISARAARAAIAFRLSAKVRAYSIRHSRGEPRDAPASSPSSCLVVIAVARTCGFGNGETGLQRLGADAEALLDGGREETRYDFGLGDCAARFGIRTTDRHLAQSLDRHLGDDWSVFYPAVDEQFTRVAPTRVVQNPLGRVEVRTSLWSGRPPGGSFTQFLPSRLLEACEPAATIADSYLPCAVHYPP